VALTISSIDTNWETCTGQIETKQGICKAMKERNLESWVVDSYWAWKCARFL